MPCKKLLAWATGQINQAPRQKLEFALKENRVCRALIDRHSPRCRLQDAGRKVLAEKANPPAIFCSDTASENEMERRSVLLDGAAHGTNA
jgi:hypothetical protein